MLELVYNIVLLPILLVCFMLVKLSIRCYDVYVCSFDLLFETNNDVEIQNVSCLNV